MKNIYWLLAVYLLVTISVQGQVKIINATTKQFTNLYLISYGNALKTNGFCNVIANKNQLRTTLKSGKESTINIKLDPTKYYNLILLDTSEYPNFYRDITFKYYLPGSTKSIIVKEGNIETDFWGHCEEGIESKRLDDVVIDIKNKSGGNLVKMYYKFEAAKDFERLKYLYQWDPVYKGTSKEIKIYAVKSKEEKKIFLKCYIEKKGVLSERLFEIEFKEGSDNIELNIQ
ncbi:MAG: hypothetical protein ABIR18_05920 [Chitinophagaceae bacterium]